MKNKYILLLLPVLLLTTVIAFSLSKKDENISLITKLEMENVLSYTIDGNPVSTLPSKNSGYIVKSISCENGSVLTWDNTNWLIEVEKLTTNDLCNIDFTTGSGSNTVTITTNIENSIDSLSKTTTNGGVVEFYANKGYVIESTSCTSDFTTNKITFKNVTSSKACTINLRTTLYGQLLADNPVRYTVGEAGSPRANYTDPYTEVNYNTLYTTNSTEDGSTVYYFAGQAQYNWVKFGKDKDGNQLYWRVIRTNEDGSIRLLYFGTSTTANEKANIGYGRYDVDEEYDYDNPTDINPMYVGYMYGTSGSLVNNRTNQTNSSNVKQKIDEWYSNSLNVQTDGTYTYDKYVSKTAIYCNDRSTNGNYSITSEFSFGGFYRLEAKKPSYKCGANTTGGLYESTQAIADKFSVSTASGGNGLLTYPAALITADELLFIGRSSNSVTTAWHLADTDGNFYAYNAWTMTPAINLQTQSGLELVVYSTGDDIAGDGNVCDYGIYDESIEIRPVISIKSCALFESGNGTYTNPYEISIDSTCAEMDN